MDTTWLTRKAECEITLHERGQSERPGMPERPFSVLHVGFANTGTTSLQLKFLRIAMIFFISKLNTPTSDYHHG
jgi:hypothetical protein